MSNLGDILKEELDRIDRVKNMQPAIDKLNCKIAQLRKNLRAGIKMSDGIFYEDKIAELKAAIKVLKE